MNRYNLYGTTLELIVVMFGFLLILAGVFIYSYYYNSGKEPK
jgi:hypothetical protein